MPPFGMEGLFLERIPAIEMKRISKRFLGVRANDNISFRVYPGEIHALQGENGAGKSALMSILASLCRPDKGAIRIKDHLMNLNFPDKVQKAMAF